MVEQATLNRLAAGSNPVTGIEELVRLRTAYVQYVF